MHKKLNILLIEDDRIEVLKFNRTVKSGIDHEITLANNGREALEKLKSFLPDVIILDLNMPDTNGIEFLTILKNDDYLKYIPTVILTTSNNNSDIAECYRLGIAGYMLKPLKYEDYQKKILVILEYWSLNQFKLV